MHAATVAAALLALLSLQACTAPAPSRMAFTGTMSGVPAEAVLDRVGDVWFLELHANGGDAGRGSVTAPVQVAVEVVSAPSGYPSRPPAVAVTRPAISPDGRIVPVLDTGMILARAAQGAAARAGRPGPPATTLFGSNLVGDPVALDVSTFDDTLGSECRIDARIPTGGHLYVRERSCAVDRDPSIRFTGELAAVPGGSLPR